MAFNFSYMDNGIKRFEKSVVISDGDDDESYAFPADTWSSEPTELVDYSRSLVGRVFTRKSVNIDHLGNTLIRAMNPAKGMEISRIGDERFLLFFNHERDRKRALECSPWTFDKYPIILAAVPENSDPATIPLDHCDFMVHAHGLPFTKRSRAVAEFVGNKLGIFREVDFEHDNRARPDTLRIRIGIPMAVPLKRSINIRCPDGQELWIKFTYERLGSFCYLCGICDQTEASCDGRYDETFVDPSKTLPFGEWLRADSRGNSFNHRPLGLYFPQRHLQSRLLGNRGSRQTNEPRRNLSSELCSSVDPPGVPPRLAGPNPTQRLNPGIPGVVLHDFLQLPAIPPTPLEEVFQMGLISSPSPIQGPDASGPSTPPKNIIPGIGLAFHAQPVAYSQAQQLIYSLSLLSPIYHEEPIVPYVPQHVSRPILSQSMASNNAPSSVNQQPLDNSKLLVSAPSSHQKSQKHSHQRAVDDDSPTPESKIQQNPHSSTSSAPASSNTLQIICSPEDLPSRKKGKYISPATQNLTTLDLENVPLKLSIPTLMANQGTKTRRFKAAKRGGARKAVVPVPCELQRTVSPNPSQPQTLALQAAVADSDQHQLRTEEGSVLAESVEAAEQPRREP